ncbi:MAG: glycerophosphodiester phosphodiesterase [Planctomycetes bacterium]|nr:glycerophosphodiester phosphodiesterase [Planctomycetota bacterium]
MLILSHRGYHSRAPENTLEAFREAIIMGVDGIETDIRLSADKVPILFHDRLTPDGREVSCLSNAELSTVMGYPVPTLEEALQLPLPGKKSILWNLEIKTPSALDVTITILGKYLSTRRLLITSFWHPVIAEVGRRIAVDCGILVAHRPLDLRSRSNWIPNDPHVNTIVWCWETLDADLVAQSTACGLRNFVYGATTPSEHRCLVGWKVDGIITDSPEYLIRRMS